ncbi:MAG: 30S ribosomal protein S5 [Candidatus Nanoclepta minutus]|uniref:Small ribosomal subunit protein uS5 n=1 Tax=Candidatus Nanoclepta minutus TaxID=1940235 RepID=A0A397WNN0_9ARCH|nr:MAG: 30S ribosomal protein S5 [Candidatus Nanoclepta minutus]
MQEEQEEAKEKIGEWIPKTRLGKMVKEGKIGSIEQIFLNGYKILEPEIVDFFIPDLKIDFIRLGLSIGKYRRPKIVKMVRRKTAEGDKPSWVALAVVGNGNGYVGVGLGKSYDIPLAMQKAVRKAKLNIIPVGRGCGAWECACGNPHSVPFKVRGKVGSVEVVFIPAPLGTGLVAPDEIKKLLVLAGIKDVWMQSFGQTRRRINFIRAAFLALKQTMEYGIKQDYVRLSGLRFGFIQ